MAQNDSIQRSNANFYNQLDSVKWKEVKLECILEKKLKGQEYSSRKLKIKDYSNEWYHVFHRGQLPF